MKETLLKITLGVMALILLVSGSLLADAMTRTVDDDNDEEEFVSAVGAIVSDIEAIDIAIAHTGGVFSEFDTDMFEGRRAYEIEINKNGNEADVLVDMETGQVLLVEWEDDE